MALRRPAPRATSARASSPADAEAQLRLERLSWCELASRVSQGTRPDLVLRAAARAAASIAGEGASAGVYTVSRGECPRPQEIAGGAARVLATGAPGRVARSVAEGASLCLAAHAGPLAKEMLGRFNGPPEPIDLAAFKTGRPQRMTVVRKAGDGARCEHLAESGYRQAAIVPLVAAGDVYGTIRVAIRQSASLPREATAALECVARLAALALERRRIVETSRGRGAGIFGRDVRAWLAGSIGLEKLLGRVALGCAAVVDAPQCFVLLLDPAAAELRCVAANPPWDQKSSEIVIPLATRRSLAAMVFKKKRAIAVLSVRTDPRSNPRLVKLLEEKSVLGLPLVVRGESIGVVMIGETRFERRFRPEEIAAAEEVASVAALVIENARRHRDAHDARERAEILLEVARDCQAGVDLHDTMHRIARRTIEITTAERCSIYLVDAQQKNIVEIVHEGWPAKEGKLLEQIVGSRLDAHPAGRALLRSRRALLFDDVGEHGIPREMATELKVRAVCVVPVRARGEYLATFAVGYPAHVSRIPREEVPLLEGVATQVALALANARAFAEVARQRVELDVLTSRMIGAQEDERRRIARELHDGVSQTLTAVKFELERHMRRPDASDEIKRAVQTLGEAIGEVRRLCVDLRPSQLDHLGLVATVQWYCKSFQKRTGIETDVDAEEIPALAPDIEINVYRIVQEALSNIAKHAGARRVTVRMRERARRLEAAVVDDGAGFDPAAKRRRGPGEGGMGLLTMSERAHLLGGELSIKSKPGKGTTVELSVPIRRRPERPPEGAGWSTAGAPDGA